MEGNVLGTYYYDKVNGGETVNQQQDKDRIPPLKALNEQHDTLLAGLYMRDEKSGLNPLTMLLKVEVLATHLVDGHLLFLRALAAGGNNRTTENFLTKVF